MHHSRYWKLVGRTVKHFKLTKHVTQLRCFGEVFAFSCFGAAQFADSINQQRMRWKKSAKGLPWRLLSLAKSVLQLVDGHSLYLEDMHKLSKQLLPSGVQLEIIGFECLVALKECPQIYAILCSTEMPRH